MIKNRSKYVIWFVVCLCCWVAAGCRKRLWPAGQGFPDREIVFGYVDPDDSMLGFVHPDGTGIDTRVVVADDRTAKMPTWSPDGSLIALRSYPSYRAYFDPLRPQVIPSTGRTVRWCKAWGWAHGRVWITEKDQMLFNLSLPNEPDRIVLANWRTCRVLSTLYEASGRRDVELLDSAHLSSKGWLAVSRILKHTLPAPAEVLVVDPGTQEARIVGEGLAPAWSRDGEWLAYTAFDGIYIVRGDGSQKRKLVDIDSRSKGDPAQEGGLGWSGSLPAPSWSPDGKWIVYHRMTANGPVIYKVEVQSGKEVEVFKGGIYPDWRWGPD